MSNGRYWDTIERLSANQNTGVLRHLSKYVFGSIEGWSHWCSQHWGLCELVTGHCTRCSLKTKRGNKTLGFFPEKHTSKVNRDRPTRTNRALKTEAQLCPRCSLVLFVTRQSLKSCKTKHIVKWEGPLSWGDLSQLGHVTGSSRLCWTLGTGDLFQRCVKCCRRDEGFLCILHLIVTRLMFNNTKDGLVLYREDDNTQVTKVVQSEQDYETIARSWQID